MRKPERRALYTGRFPAAVTVPTNRLPGMNMSSSASNDAKVASRRAARPVKSTGGRIARRWVNTPALRASSTKPATLPLLWMSTCTLREGGGEEHSLADGPRVHAAARATHVTMATGGVNTMSEISPAAEAKRCSAVLPLNVGAPPAVECHSPVGLAAFPLAALGGFAGAGEAPRGERSTRAGGGLALRSELRRRAPAASLIRGEEATGHVLQLRLTAAAHASEGPKFPSETECP